MNRKLAVTLVVALAAAAAFAQEKNAREQRVREDKERVAALDSWIYDDLPRGVEEARKSGKPLLVVFRCIPCEACAQIDEDVVRRDPIVAKLLDQFVCVRVPHANGMDLSVFQFDYDQSWAAFLMNADMTVYGRYGTRSSQKDASQDVSLEGFAKALESALAVHARPRGAEGPSAAKPGEPPPVAKPEDLASLKGRYASSLDWEGKVVASCIHCHQVGEAMRRDFRDAGKPIPEKVLFPYPNPKALGLVLDPKGAALVKSVVPGSSAEKDGFQPGDEILVLGGQPVGSVADVQWALHNAGDAKSLDADVFHEGVRAVMPPTKLTLPAGWRSRDDISWRATSWDLRRMTTGGMRLEPATAAERAKAGVKDGAMALAARHVGQHGDHAAAKNAGFREGDVLVAVDGRTDVLTETAWMTWLVNARKPGEKVPVTVVRGAERVELTLPMQ